MLPTYLSISDLKTDLEALIFWTASAEVPYPDAISSHIRVRSSIPEQYKIFQAITADPSWVYAKHTIEHKGQPIIFTKLVTPLYYLNNPNQPIFWLEFTVPSLIHNDGPDAVVFKVPNLKESHTIQVTSQPLVVLRFQPLSAEEIVNA